MPTCSTKKNIHIWLLSWILLSFLLNVPLVVCSCCFSLPPSLRKSSLIDGEKKRKTCAPCSAASQPTTKALMHLRCHYGWRTFWCWQRTPWKLHVPDVQGVQGKGSHPKELWHMKAKNVSKLRVFSCYAAPCNTTTLGVGASSPGSQEGHCKREKLHKAATQVRPANLFQTIIFPMSKDMKTWNVSAVSFIAKGTCTPLHAL